MKKPAKDHAELHKKIEKEVRKQLKSFNISNLKITTIYPK